MLLAQKYSFKDETASYANGQKEFGGALKLEKEESPLNL